MTKQELNLAFSKIRMDKTEARQLYEKSSDLYQKKKERKNRCKDIWSKGLLITAGFAFACAVFWLSGIIKTGKGTASDPVMLDVTETVNSRTDTDGQLNTSLPDTSRHIQQNNPAAESSEYEFSGFIEIEAIDPAVSREKAVLIDLCARLYREIRQEAMESIIYSQTIPGLQTEEWQQEMQTAMEYFDAAPPEIWILSCDSVKMKELIRESYSAELLPETEDEVCLEAYLNHIENRPFSKIIEVQARRAGYFHAPSKDWTGVIRDSIFDSVSMMNDLGITQDILIAFPDESITKNHNSDYLYFEFSPSCDGTLLISYGYADNTITPFLTTNENEINTFTSQGISYEVYSYRSSKWAE